jgi:hypothetical protein
MSDDRPSLFDLLLGRHGYSMTPELETSWCRACVALGWVVGLATALLISEWMR